MRTVHLLQNRTFLFVANTKKLQKSEKSEHYEAMRPFALNGTSQKIRTPDNLIPRNSCLDLPF
jgi:transposase